MTRVLVCGGRDFGDLRLLRETLDLVHVLFDVSCVIAGRARGADTLAERWADLRGISVDAYPADWSTGRGAGHARNQRMLSEGKPDLVVAFAGGRGTADMIRRSRAAGVPVYDTATGQYHG